MRRAFLTMALLAATAGTVYAQSGGSSGGAAGSGSSSGGTMAPSGAVGPGGTLGTPRSGSMGSTGS